MESVFRTKIRRVFLILVGQTLPQGDPLPSRTLAQTRPLG